MTTFKAETQHKILVEIEPETLVQRLSAYGVLVKDNKILLIKTHSDNWELPGGTPEPGETLKQGLERELKEEVGLLATIGDMFFVRESFYHTPSAKTYHSLQFYFFISAQNAPSAAEATDFDFIAKDDITKQNTNTSSYVALQHLNQKHVQYDLWAH